MIKKTTEKGKTKVTFVLPYEESQPAASVVGDFNNWDVTATRLVKRNNGTRSVTVVLEPEQRYLFRYYSEDGLWFNEDSADGYAASEHGSENCVLLT